MPAKRGSCRVGARPRWWSMLARRTCVCKLAGAQADYLDFRTGVVSASRRQEHSIGWSCELADGRSFGERHDVPAAASPRTTTASASRIMVPAAASQSADDRSFSERDDRPGRGQQEGIAHGSLAGTMRRAAGPSRSHVDRARRRRRRDRPEAFNVGRCEFAAQPPSVRKSLWTRRYSIPRTIDVRPSC
jgi:hypothetical protein